MISITERFIPFSSSCGSISDFRHQLRGATYSPPRRPTENLREASFDTGDGFRCYALNFEFLHIQLLKTQYISNRKTLLRTPRILLQRLLQRLFQLSLRYKPFKLSPDDSFAVHYKNPRLRYQAPLFHSRKTFLLAKFCQIS